RGRLPHEAAGRVERGIARGEVRHQRALAAPAQRREGLLKARHARAPWPLAERKARSTVCTSLSPRPDSPTTTASVFFILAAARTAWATACAASSAGVLPSSRVSVWKASSASASVTDT